MSEQRPLILLIDDEAHILHVVKLKLDEAGFDVVTAPDGREGLALALDRLPSLIITDHQMPFVTGVELSKHLRDNPATSSIPILMVTARGFNISDDYLKTNIAAVITKPFSPREILAKVKDLLSDDQTDQKVNDVA